MKRKKSFSKIDYLLLLLDDFKDQLTVILGFNIAIRVILIAISNLLDDAYLSVSYPNFFSNKTQYSITDIATQSGYIFFGCMLIHFYSYKHNKKWIFIINSSILFVLSNWMLSMFSFNQMIQLVLDCHWPLILILTGQLFFNLIWLNHTLKQLLRK